MTKPPIYGLMAEFRNVTALVEATRAARDAGYKRMDAYSPFPVEELSDALGHHHDRLPLLVLIGGIAGGAAGFFLQYYAAVIDYPLNIGGRPLLSWPAFIPVTFETTILAAAFVAVLGMLGLNGLPEPYHPVFNVERFVNATRSRFFLCIEARDPKFDRVDTAQFLESLEPRGVYEVAH
ncbi:MAG TPA: DUF3341 domain-containing protein [Bryobacteraceae bacterium]|jgi:hypothetical protein|nr:DUF3341 domain-containing protein [Bryobacteraceae bacterium]